MSGKAPPSLGEAVFKNPAVILAGICGAANMIMVFTTFGYVPSFLTYYSKIPSDLIYPLSLLFFIIPIPSAFVVGAIQTRTGNGAPLMLCGLLGNLTTGATLLTNNVFVLAICLALMGWFQIWVTTQMVTVCTRTVPPQYTGSAVGFASLLAYLIGSVALFIAPSMLSIYGWAGPWLTVEVVCLVAVFICLALIPIEKRMHKKWQG